MLSIKKILVIIEPEADSQLALDKALRLARKSGAALELLIADHSTYLEDGYYFDPIQAADLRKEHLAANRRLLEEMATVIRKQGFTVEIDALWGNPPYEQVIDKVLKSQPDLLVQSTRHHERIARLLLSHQDWQLLRYCPCPILLVKDEPWKDKPVVLVSVDPTHANDKPAELDDRLTEMGTTVASLTGGSAHIFHSCYQMPVSGIYPVKVDESVYREETAKLLEKYSIAESNLHLSEEEIQKSLPATADSLNADLVVMGAISRSRLDRFFIGNTAEKLLDRLHQDVLVLKPEGFTDRVKKARQVNL
jgi:universal stress protein E